MLILIQFDSRKHRKSGDKVRGGQDYLQPQKCGPGRSKCNYYHYQRESLNLPATGHLPVQSQE